MATHRQRIIWTALPNGVLDEGGVRQYRLSLYLAPRLESDASATLADFPDLLVWPQRVLEGSVTFSVEISGRPPLPIVPIALDRLDPVRWQALFPATMPVADFVFDDHTEHPMVTYSVGRVQRYLKSRYQEVAVTALFGLPTTTQLAETFSSLAGLGDRGAVWRSELDRRHQGLGFSTPDEAAVAAEEAARAQVRQDFLDLETFHHRPSMEEQLPIPPAAEQAKQFDFHGTLSALGDYGNLQRRLGLVLDFLLPGDALEPPPAAEDGVRIVPAWATPPTAERTDLSPWTRTAWSRFRAGSKLANVALEAGFVDPGVEGSSGLELVQVDVDGAAIKAVGMAASLERTPPPQSAESVEPARAGTPTLRSAGFSIVRPENARAIFDTFATGLSLNDTLQTNAADLELFAEDLVRGFRVDVWESRTGNWRSLHERIGSYHFPEAPYGYEVWTEQPDAEGFSKLAVTERFEEPPAANGNNNKPLYIHESIVTWDGWSLSAPRVGKVIPSPVGTPIEDGAAPDQTEADAAQALQQTDESTPVEESTIRVRNERAGDIGLETDFAVVPGTLPRLRFGNDHQFRLRTVDLAGNGLSLVEADAALVSSPDAQHAVMPPNRDTEGVFRRFDAVVAPVVVPREQLRRGDGLDRIVLRSNYNVDPGAYIGAHPLYERTNERHIVPAKTPQVMAELHGQLDASFGDTEAARALVWLTYTISSRDKATLRDDTVLDVTTGAYQEVGWVEITDPDSTGEPPMIVSAPAVQSYTLNEKDESGSYTVHREAYLRVPYLPDPLARGASLRLLPGPQSGALGQVQGAQTTEYRLLPMADDLRDALGTITKVPFHSGEWPDLQTFRLRLIEGETAGETIWLADERALCVTLPKGSQTALELSTFISPEDLRLLGIWQWIKERLATGIQPDDPPHLVAALQTLATEPDALNTLAAAGAVWMLTPAQPITLVHAVQQPIEEPKLVAFAPFTDDDVVRPRGATFVQLAGQVRLHAGSTGRLDLQATWNEIIDRPQAPAPATVTADATVYTTTIALPGPDASPYLVELPAIDEAALKHDFGDTKYRRIRYWPVGTTRFSEFFADLALDPDDLSRRGPDIVIDVPSSARPPAPLVKYVVPAFEWTATTDEEDQMRVRERRGGGVRVYLDRPWYASGDGEVLGVILWEGPPADTLPDLAIETPPPPAPGDEDAAAEQRPAGEEKTTADLVEELTTRWGRDPIWRTHPTLAAPGLDRFRRATVSATGLFLPELRVSGELLGPVGVAGHAVEFDNARKLWFCDIGIDAGATYFPFVRLALARYQPHAIPGAHLSSVVLADFVQLAPDRAVSVISDPDNPDILELAMTGSVVGAARGVDSYAGRTEQLAAEPDVPSGATQPDLAAQPRIEVAVEKRMPGASDDLGWMPVTLPVPIEAYPLTDAGGATPGLLWSGRVTLPPGRVPGHYRVVLREYDWYAADNPKWEGEADPNGPSAADAEGRLPFRPYKRLVFADAIEV